MRISHLLALCLSFCTSFVNAQWLSNGDLIYNSNSGNVGIGTNHPVGRFQVLKKNVWGDPSSTSTTIDNMLILQAPYQGTVPASYNGTGYKWGLQFWGKNDSDVSDQYKSGAVYAVSEDGEYGFNRAIGLAFHTSPYDAASLEQLRITSKGNVGIGTDHPTGRLQVLKSNVWGDPSSTSTSIDNLIILQTPYQGTTPVSYNGTGYKWGIQFWGKNDASQSDQEKSGGIYAVSEDGNYGFNRAVGLVFHTTALDATSAERFRITSAGNVGIGTADTKGYKLAVAGNAVAESITVKTQNTWPDYVFDKDYKALSLTDLSTYIAKNKHLPGMPSSQEIEKNGQNLGHINLTLVKNLEELTLHLIEENKSLRAQQDRMAIQDDKIEKLQAALEKLLAR